MIFKTGILEKMHYFVKVGTYVVDKAWQVLCMDTKNKIQQPKFSK
jgi:hypothetical protein